MSRALSGGDIKTDFGFWNEIYFVLNKKVLIIDVFLFIGMVTMVALSVVDCWYDPLSCRTKNYNVGICCFSPKHLKVNTKTGCLAQS
jgi:hypothetical protein